MKVCWSKCFGHSDAGDQGKEGERDDDKGHFLAEQGKEDLLQRSLPQVKNLCVHLVHSIIDNLMARCVARNPKEMMRQVAAAKELDSAKVGEVFKPESPLISSCRRELSCLLAGRSGTAFCVLINYNLTNPGSGHNQPLQPRVEGLWRPQGPLLL